MPDYSKGKIYAIRSKSNNDVYIGSTIRPLGQRFSEHKHLFKTNLLRCSSRDILKYDDAYIELIEDYPCNSCKELTLRESELIKTIPFCINMKIPQQTRKQYRDDNKEVIIKRNKIYYESNKDSILEKQKEYRIINKDKINEKQKECLAKNKEKYNEARRIKRAMRKSKKDE